jgi:hypothetical protein
VDHIISPLYRIRPVPTVNTMNKPLFAVICMICMAGGILLAFVTDFPDRDLAGILVFVLAVLPALAWLRLRAEGRRKSRAEFKRRLIQSQSGSGHPISKGRQRRRRLVAMGILTVGVGLHFQDPPIVLKGTTISVGLIMVLAGALLLLGELMGINAFRDTPLDHRLDGVVLRRGESDLVKRENEDRN